MARWPTELEKLQKQAARVADMTAERRIAAVSELYDLSQRLLASSPDPETRLRVYREEEDAGRRALRRAIEEIRGRATQRAG